MQLVPPLYLDVDVKSWGVITQEHGSLMENTSQEVLDIYRRVLERDHYQCYYCGFQSDKYQEVHHKDHNHHNHDMSNLTTVCPLCHANFHLNLADLHEGAQLIWCPDSHMTQQDINHLCRMLFILNQMNENAGSEKGHYVQRMGFTTVYTTILSNGVRVLEEYFPGASNCGTMGQVLLDIKKKQPEVYKERDKWLPNIKMLHNPMRFYVQTTYWMNSMRSNRNFRPDQWVNLTVFRDEQEKPVYTPPTANEVKQKFELDLSKLL